MTSDGIFAPYTACEFTENHADSTESECRLKMSLLWERPYSLQVGDKVVVRVQARNVIGVGEFSMEKTVEVNEVVEKELRSLFPSIPVPRESNRTASSLTITWDPVFPTREYWL